MNITVASGFWSGVVMGVLLTVVSYAFVAVIIGFQAAIRIAEQNDVRRLADEAEERNIAHAQMRRSL
jgi:hypothetical protein